MQKKTNKGELAKLAVIGASLAGLAATAYFLFGPKSKKHKQQAKAWAIKMKGEVIEKLEAAREITEPAYLEIVDAVSKEYKKGKKASQAEIDALAKDLKAHWKSMSKLAVAAKKSAVKNMARTVKEVKAVQSKKKS